MIPAYTLDLRTLGQRTDRLVVRDVAHICAVAWLAFFLFALVKS